MKNKNLIKCIVSALLLVCLCVLIFYFSSQPGEASSQTSISITQKLLAPILNLFNSTTDYTQFFAAADVFVRKAAHFTEYAVVGVLALIFFSSLIKKSKVTYAVAVIYGFLYACSDEIHQLFVPGRSGQITDVLLDSMGVCFGAAVTLFVLKHIKRKSRNTDK